MHDTAPSPPRFAVRDGYALYRGPVTDGPIHRHGAFQIAIAIEGEVAMAGRRGSCTELRPCW